MQGVIDVLSFNPVIEFDKVDPKIVWTALIKDDVPCKAQAMKNTELFSLQELIDKYCIQYATSFTTNITASSQ